MSIDSMLILPVDSSDVHAAVWLRATKAILVAASDCKALEEAQEIVRDKKFKVAEWAGKKSRLASIVMRLANGGHWTPRTYGMKERLPLGEYWEVDNQYSRLAFLQFTGKEFELSQSVEKSWFIPPELKDAAPESDDTVSFAKQCHQLIKASPKVEYRGGALGVGKYTPTKKTVFTPEYRKKWETLRKAGIVEVPEHAGTHLSLVGFRWYTDTNSVIHVHGGETKPAVVLDPPKAVRKADPLFWQG